MKRYYVVLLPLFSCVSILLFFNNSAMSQDKKQIIHLARLVIDSAQLENYKGLLREEIETAVQVEPGVITLYAVSEKNHPDRITILEIYADEDAYKKHLQTAHFIKYKTGSKNMVRSLELIDADPLMPGLKVK